jgi:L-tartrate/succinate antiporter
MKKIGWRALIPIIVGIIIIAIPVPAGLKPNAWYYFAIFVATILAIILEPIPVAGAGLVGVALSATLCLVEPSPGNSIRWALAGFSNTTVWLVCSAFVFSLGYEKTGLGRRIALALVKILGGKTLGLGYAIALTDLIIAPFTPSSTARSGGMIFPIIQNIPGLYGSHPGETARKIGSYIMWTGLAASTITSAIFSTAGAPNLLALALVKKTVNIDITWFDWFVGFLPCGLILFVSLPFLIYIIYPPEIKTSKEIPPWAAQELRQMGKITSKESGLALLVILALALWIFGGKFMDAATVGVMIVSLMLVGRIITWNDILENKPLWNTFVWIGTLVTLADGLNKVGFVTWFAKGAAALLTGMSPVTVMIILTVIYFVVHYMFASNTAHVTAILPVMLAAGTALPGVPPKMLAMLLCYSIGLQGIITPYATGPSPVYYGSGYLPRKDFWRLGAIFGFIFLAIMLITEIPYLSLLKP